MTMKRNAPSGRNRVHASQNGHVLQDRTLSDAIESHEASGHTQDSYGITAAPSPVFESFPSSYAMPLSLSKSTDSLARNHQAWKLHHLLWDVFTTVLEPRIGLWIGSGGCPFAVTNSVRLFFCQFDAELMIAQPTTRISRLMIDLDKYNSRGSTNRNAGLLTGNESERDSSCIINRALIYAVYAYCVRWLDLGENQQSQRSQTQCRLTRLKQELSENLWTQARKHIYGALSRPSYRSILALYLFAIIPSSPRKTGDNLEDHCIEASLSHHNYLNSRRVPVPLGCGDSITSLLENASFSRSDHYSLDTSLPQPADDKQRSSMSNLAQWFGIISDTTRALIRCRPSVLLPPGCDSETKVWAPVRARTQSFQSQFDSLRQLQTPIRDDQLMEILQHAHAYKTLVWAAITRVQDALVHQMSGISVAEAVEAARKESNAYQEIFGTLLCLGLRDFMLLNRTTQMYFSEYEPPSSHLKNGNTSSSTSKYPF